MPVQRGDTLRIRARDWNRLLDLAEYADTAATPAAASTLPVVRNNTASTVPRFGVLQIVGRLGDRETDSVLLVGQAPTVTSKRPIAVAIEPIRPNRLGRCVTSGVAFCRIDNRMATHWRAVGNNSVNALRGSDDGDVEILAPAGDNLYVVRVGTRSDSFVGRIYARTPLTFGRWLYHVEEQTYNGTTWVAPTHGRDVPAYNIREWNNAPTGELGNGLTATNCFIPACGMTPIAQPCILPAGVGTLVQLWPAPAADGVSYFYVFEHSNTVSPQRQWLYRFILTSSLVRGGTANANIMAWNYTTGSPTCIWSTAQVKDTLGCFAGIAGTPGFCALMPDSNLYEIVTLCC